MIPNSGADVAFFLPLLSGGGAERVILNLAIGFADRGLRTDLVLGKAEGPYLAQVPANVRVVDLDSPRVLRALRPLTAYLRREKPMAMLAALDHANLVAMAAGRLAGGKTKTVISIHLPFAKQLEEDTSLTMAALPWLLGRLHRWADGIVAVSAGVADDVTRATGIPRERVDVIYNPVIMPTLLKAAAQPPGHPWFEDGDVPVVLGVGRLTPQKNFPLLIEAFALARQTHDARLVILGEGQDRAALEALIQARGLEDCVALPGFVANPYACMSRAAVFVLSSDYEGLPTVLIESLAVGTPVVSTDCDSGPRVILRDGALGDLVPVGDVDALAGGIVRAIGGTRTPVAAAELLPFTLNTVVDQFHKALGLHA
jgi:glycosyltransferase involved in cell wall biosynthesis